MKIPALKLFKVSDQNGWFIGEEEYDNPLFRFEHASSGDVRERFKPWTYGKGNSFWQNPFVELADGTFKVTVEEIDDPDPLSLFPKKKIVVLYKVLEMQVMGHPCKVEIGDCAQFVWDDGTRDFATRSGLDNPGLYGVSPEDAKMLQEEIDKFVAIRKRQRQGEKSE